MIAGRIDKLPFAIRAPIVIVGILALCYMLYIAQGIIIPIIYATIIAIVLSPVVDFLVRKKMNRVLAISITLTLVIILSVSIILLLSSQFSMFSDSFPEIIRQFQQLLQQTISWASANFHISTTNIDVWIAETNKEILNAGRSVIGQTILNIGSMMVVMVLIPVYLFMILFYQPHLIAFIHQSFGKTRTNDVSEVLVSTKRIIRSYLVGLLLEALIIAILNSTGLLILGIDYAILLGVFGALVNVIPYLGGIISVALPMMIALATKSPSSALLVLAVYLPIQFVDNHYLIPKIVASKVKLNALVSIIAVLCGGALWGFPGMFLSIPLTAIMKVIFDHIEGLKPLGFLLGNSIVLKPLLINPLKWKKKR